MMSTSSNSMDELIRLNEIDFVDLVMGADFCELQGAAPDSNKITRLRPVPPEVESLVEPLRELCTREFKARGTPEFGLKFGDVVYRVTVMDKGEGALEFSVRKSTASLRKFSELALPAHVLRAVAKPDLTGLVLVVGASGSGKTSTAYSLTIERLRRFGGIGRTIEQPIEARLEGRHEEGRCSQLEVEREEDYDRELRLVLRTNARLIMLGELRTSEAARTAALAGINGHLIISTMHASSVEDAIERFADMAGGGLNNARELVAAGLALVIHQKFAAGFPPRLVTKALSLVDSDQSAATIKGKIRTNRISAVSQEVDDQQRKSMYDSRRPEAHEAARSEEAVR